MSSDCSFLLADSREDAFVSAACLRLSTWEGVRIELERVALPPAVIGKRSVCISCGNTEVWSTCIMCCKW